jgi:hypothetical protein
MDSSFCTLFSVHLSFGYSSPLHSFERIFPIRCIYRHMYHHGYRHHCYIILLILIAVVSLTELFINLLKYLAPIISNYIFHTLFPCTYIFYFLVMVGGGGCCCFFCECNSFISSCTTRFEMIGPYILQKCWQ